MPGSRMIRACSLYFDLTESRRALGVASQLRYWWLGQESERFGEFAEFGS